MIFKSHKNAYFCRMFSNNMKLFFTVVCTTLLFGACSPYQKALKGDDVGVKFHFADSLYNAGKYKKGLKLMEQIVPVYRGKPQAEKLMFIYSDTYYQLEDYYLAGYQFERFVVSYPSSQKVEEAAFKSAKSYYQLSPRYSLDQKDTYIALDKLQQFINSYPESEYLKEANSLVAELTNKIEKKRFEIAKQYYYTKSIGNNYKAAIEAFDNFIIEFPGSEFREKAHYLRFEAAYTLAINSYSYLVQERLEQAKSYYNTYIRYYPNGEDRAQADEILEDIERRLNEIQS